MGFLRLLLRRVVNLACIVITHLGGLLLFCVKRYEMHLNVGCNTGGLGCCAREAEEFELVLRRTCDQCSMVRTESDDTLYICDPRGEKVSDGMTCDAFDAT